MGTKTYKVSRQKAVQLAMNHNKVSFEIANNYTDSELKEVLKHLSGKWLKMEADFYIGLIEAIAECDFRIREGANPRIQLEALLTKFI